MTTIFVLVLLIFMGDVPVDGKLGGPFESMAQCEQKKKEAAKRAKEIDADAAMLCVEIKHKPKPVSLKPERYI